MRDRNKEEQSAARAEKAEKKDGVTGGRERVTVPDKKRTPTSLKARI